MSTFTESPKTGKRKYTISEGTLLYPLKGKAAYPPPIDKEYP